MRLIFVLFIIALLAAVMPAATAPVYTWASGAGDTFIRVSFSAQGNIVALEHPFGVNHMAGTLAEGPAIEWADSAWRWKSAESLGFRDFGWAAPYKVEAPNGPNMPPLRIYRKTYVKDQKFVDFELKQEFNWIPAEGKIIVTMTLYNRSGKIQRNVQICRWVDIDQEGKNPNLFWYAGPDTAVVLPDVPFGMAKSATVLRNMSPKQFGWVDLISWSTLKDTSGQTLSVWGCTAGGLDNLPSTDGLVRMQWGIWDTLKAGASIQVIVHISVL